MNDIIIKWIGVPIVIGILVPLMIMMLLLVIPLWLCGVIILLLFKIFGIEYE